MRKFILLLFVFATFQAQASLIEREGALNLGLTFTDNMTEGSISIASNTGALAVYKLQKTGKNSFEALTGMAVIKVTVSEPRSEDGYKEYDVTLAYEGEDATNEVDQYTCSSVEW
jgi:hypothetical protein